MPPHLVKDDQSPVVSSFRSPAMTFAGRVVVMNGGRIAMGEARTKSEAKCNSDGAQGRN